MAHLIEHMIFKGTEKRNVGEISRDVEAAGGYLNAFTSFEHTCFYVVLPSAQILKALDIEFDAFLNSTFDAKELEKEKEVVFEEMKMRRDDPWSWSWELLFTALFKKNPYHWPVIGDEKVLRAVPRENLKKYYQKHYVPEKTVICVVGDVSIPEIEKWVRDHFEKVTAPSPAPRRFEMDEEPTQLQFLDEPGDVQQTYVSLAFPTVPLNHPDAAALEVLDAVFSDGGSSRLSLAIREGTRSADEVGAEHFTGKYGGSFVFQAVTDRKRVERLLKEIMEQVAGLSREVPTGEELAKIKTRIKASKIFEKQSVDGQAKTLGFWQLQGDYRLEENFLAALDAVTASDVLEVCRKYIQPRRATLLFYRPKTEKGFDPGPHWQAQLEKALTAAKPSRVTRPGKNERLQRFKLSNGSKLLVRERHGVPLVSLGVYLKGGFRDEKEAQSGLTSLMTRVLLKGNEKRSYAEYSRAVESLAAHVDPVLEKDYWGVACEGLSTQLDPVFNLMMETFLTPAFSKEEVEKEKQMQLAALRRLKDDPSEYALLKSDVSTFAGTPYAHPPQGTAKSVARLSPQAVRGWYEKLRRASNMTWVAVGDVEPLVIKNRIEEALKNVPKGKSASRSGKQKLKSFKTKSYFEKNNSQQSNLVLGFPAPHFKHPDYFTFRVMNTLLNGMGGRLFVELREKNSLAYSVFAAHEALEKAGIYQVYIGCAPEKQEMAKRELQKALTRLAQDPITPEELSRAKTYMIGLYQVGSQANRSQMNMMTRYELSGPGAEAVEEFPKRVEAVTAAAVKKVAAKYLKLNLSNWVVLSPETPKKGKA
jgi:zinc protease